MSAATGSQAGPAFAVRIVSLDYYLAPPVPGLDVCYSSLEGTAVERVPVVRVFGATPAGQKCCLHLHRVRGYNTHPGPDGAAASRGRGAGRRVRRHAAPCCARRPPGHWKEGEAASWADAAGPPLAGPPLEILDP